MQQITPLEVSALDAPVIIDVREANELEAARVPGATHIAMSSFLEHLGEIPREETVYILCHAGSRSAQVTNYLEQQGYDAVNITGGITEWAASGLPVER
ncbi:rhodanese-like domain-containing protein [Plantibacter sp. Mn2098]|uniref:rhodanese-like domain-containing protein n=1 Tax=Plantibacter sp. Mn2098 TaxID=3395266 RepID=UPI003BDE1FB7